MTDISTQAMFTFLREILHSSPVSDAVSDSWNAEDLAELYALAKKHDLAHVVGYAARLAGMPSEGEWAGRFKREEIAAVYRYESLRFELERLGGALQQAGIPFIPLKGSVIRGVYPEPWMRTSCDIDVLVHSEDLSRAADCLRDTLQYTGGDTKGTYDVQLRTPRRLHIELHYRLAEQGRVVCAEQTLDRVWEHLEPAEDGVCLRRMTDEMFFFHHIAHMAKHIEGGGCGVRPFLDLWILEHRVPHDRGRRDALLREGGLLTFADACRRLAESWFSDEPMDDVSERLQEFVLTGGVYGSQDNRVAVQQNKSGGKFRYALRRVFLPYDDLKYHYPVLQKHPWLTPVGHLRRWCKLLLRGGMPRAMRELQRNERMQTETVDRVAQLLQDVGL